jgi:hypothetical protein
MVAPVTGRVKPLELPELLVSAASVVVEVSAVALSAAGLASVFRVDSEEDEDSTEDEEDDEVDAAFLPIVSFRPGWIRLGSAPMAVRLSE